MKELTELQLDSEHDYSKEQFDNDQSPASQAEAEQVDAIDTNKVQLL